MEVAVFCGYSSRNDLNNGKILVSRQSKNLTLFRFPIPELPPRHTWFQVINSRRMYELAKMFNPDVIHGQSGSTFPAAITLKNIAPLLVTFHACPKFELMMSVSSLRRGGSFGDIWTYGIGYPAYSLTYRRELKSASISVAVSKSLRSELLNEMGWKHQEKFRVVSNGINLKQLDKEYSSFEKEETKWANDIVYAGRLYWRKGVMELIRLAYLIKKKNLNSRIVVYGKGPLFEKLNHTRIELGLNNLILKGFTSRSELMCGLRTSKFVLIPSFYEACPMVLLEAMCLGKIPLMYNLPFSAEFTENGHFGILARNASDLVDKFVNLNEKADLATLSDRIRSFGRQEYDIKKTAKYYCKLYDEV